MNALPYGIADPLHIEEPFAVWKLIAAGLVLWLLYRLFRRLRKKRAVTRPIPPPPVPRSATGISAVIGEIRRRYRQDCRRGCHELAAALRSHFGAREGHPYPTLTAREMARRIGDTPVAGFFGLLTELQFFRREPTRNDFEGVCDLALEVAGTAAENRQGKA